MTTLSSTPRIRVLFGAALVVVLCVPSRAYANAIVPYMVVPWGQVLLLPIVALVETPLVRHHLGGGFGLGAWHSVLANLASTLAGAALGLVAMRLFGDWLFEYWSGAQYGPDSLQRSMLISGAFAALLYLVSGVVEARVLRSLRPNADPSRVRRCALQANGLTYGLLLALSVAFT